MKINEYIETLRQSLKHEGSHNLFFPMNKEKRKKSLLRLAREFGYGLSIYTENEVNQMIGSTYGILVVANCFDSIGPQIDAKTWIKTIQSSLRKVNNNYNS